MKKALYTALFCAILTSCGGSKVEDKEPESFDDMKKAVCDCFKEEDKKMKCAKMQHDYSEKQESEEERIRFIQETNECM